jgi:hypothetical protein
LEAVFKEFKVLYCKHPPGEEFVLQNWIRSAEQGYEAFRCARLDYSCLKVFSPVTHSAWSQNGNSYVGQVLREEQAFTWVGNTIVLLIVLTDW